MSTSKQSTPATSGSRFWPLIKLLPAKTNFRYVRYAKVIGIVLVLACIASMAAVLTPLRGPCAGLNCGIDFTGGTSVQLSTAPRQADLGVIRSTLNELGFGDVQVQAFENGTDVSTRFETPEGEVATVAVDRAKTALTEALGPTRFGSTEVVGSKVSGELFFNGVLALVLAIGLMMTYIWFRFGLTFGLGAALALINVVILTLGMFAVTKLDFTLNAVAAILTIIGYSVNDTIVVLDRIRENLRKYKKMPLGEVIDLSINETLSRTVITGTTGLMALAGLAIFGGEALYGFSIAMIFGIVAGTFSSIFVAAPALQILGVNRGAADDATGPVKLGMASRP